ncbi:DUF58 domain-containing protein [Paenibacillus chitinolyticus]|uniref:DUF58 domain-containing protein n=1 Tax=Paenibacillus chitinolyticus TaxID=79263 RepID=UPI002DB7D670|nr:DUF58 domain-containing protein [Paenibacillus chitinolyticus]MEC0245364.1 DUF58 domain-containing protein [Paenibacillus chitinolyticus]
MKLFKPTAAQKGRQATLILSFLFFASLMFLLFQGGKLASTLFAVVCLLSAYLVLGKWSGIRQTQAVREISAADGTGKVQAGQSLQIKLKIQVPGVWPIPYLLIQDELVRSGGEKTVMKGSVVLNWMRKGEFVYKTPPLRRGHYSLERAEFATEDVFGLYEHKGSVHLPYGFVVMPQMIEIRHWAQFSQSPRGARHHSVTARMQRETTQINGVREYIHGDRLSRVHWNATARTGTWKSKEFERETLPKMVLVLDRSKHNYGSPAEFELAVSIAASLLHFGTQRNIAVGLVSSGRESLMAVPKTGARHEDVLMDHLVEVEPDGFRPLQQVVNNADGMFSPGALVVYITPAKNPDLLSLLHWTDKQRMLACHLCVCGAKGGSADVWVRRLHSLGFMGYGVHALTELPAVLGGGTKIYA